MWKDISILIQIVYSGRMIAQNENEVLRILLDFRTDPRDQFLSSSRFQSLKAAEKERVLKAFRDQAKVNLSNQVYKLNYHLCCALLDCDQTENVFVFMNKYCQNNCYQSVLKIFDSLLLSFQTLPIIKMLQSKKLQSITTFANVLDNLGPEFGRSRLQHVANMGNSGRYEIYMGQNELGNGDAQEMRQRIIQRLSNQPGIEIVGEPMSGPLNPQLGDGRDGGSATNVANVEQCSAQLIDMGFAATAVERALLLTGLSFERALDLLLAEQASGEEQKDGEGEQGAVLQSALERPERPELFEEPVPGDLD